MRGYAGVGGVVGMMYNGEVANSYNLGAINTTRRPQGGNKTSVNMGGVVGDTTEESNAKAIIYNVYNKMAKSAMKLITFMPVMLVG